MRLSFAVFVTSFGSGPRELCCCLVVVLPFEDRVLMIASQVKAFDDELAELRRSHSAAASAAAAQAAASSAAAAAVQAALHHEVSALKSQIEALHNQSDGNTALLDAKAQLQSTVAALTGTLRSAGAGAQACDLLRLRLALRAHDGGV